MHANDHWAMSFEEFNGFKFISVHKGTFWFQVEGENWEQFSAGDGLILTQHLKFNMATDIECPITRFIPRDPQTKGPSVYGGNENILLSGKMNIDIVGAKFFIETLPRVIRFRTSSSTQPSRINWLMKQLYHEKESLEPGAKMVCDHLMHIIMMEIVRNWLKSEQAQKLGWMNVLNEPKLIKALNMIHEYPARNWGVVELTEIAGMSRSSFAGKFRHLMGVSPSNYVTQWRMQLASHALRQNQETIKSIAFRLGYISESSFSNTFKRVCGVAPSTYRKR